MHKTSSLRATTLLILILWAASAMPSRAQSASGPRRFSLHSIGRNPQLVAKSGATGARLILQWYQMQPGPRRMNASRLDPAVQGNRADMDPVVTLRCNSNWACKTEFKSGAGNYQKPSSMPRNMHDWTKYVTTLVERYDGDGNGDAPGLQRPIKHWQLENEFLAQWKGTDQEFIELARVTRRTIKAADPSAKMISPGFTGTRFFALKDGINTRGWIYHGNTDTARRRITAAQLQRVPRVRTMHARASDFIRQLEPLVDIFDVHLYSFDHDDLAFQLGWLKAQLQQLNSSKPIWSLEFAAPFFDFSEERFHQSIVTSQVVGFASGLDRIFWSSLAPTLGWSENYLRLSLATQQRQPKPAFWYYAMLAQNMEGFTSVTREPSDPSLHVYRFRFAAGEPDGFVIWSDQSSKVANIEIDAPMQQIEIVAGRPSRSVAGRGTIQVSADTMPKILVPAS